jgi:hypothetical protein
MNADVATSRWKESVSPLISRSISRSAASASGVPLDDRLDVRRLLGHLPLLMRAQAAAYLLHRGRLHGALPALNL